MTFRIGVCLACKREHEARPEMIPRVPMYDKMWLCAECVDSAARRLAQWRAKRRKEAEAAEAEKARQEAGYRVDHTLFAPPSEPAYAPLTQEQIVTVRQALTRLAPKHRPEFLRMMHEEARAHAHWKHKTVSDDFVRETIELLLAALTDKTAQNQHKECAE